MRATLSALALALTCAGPPAHAGEARRAWEVNGVRLEPEQVERLARDIARQTVVAVQRLDGIALDEAQLHALETIYRRVALDVYDEAVSTVNRGDLTEAEKETRIVDLVLEGQERSTRQVAEVLSPDQYEVYRRWEVQQVMNFRSRGLWSERSPGRRRR